MKCVMLSIRPKYCELIANGKKTVEVRRTKPKIDMPFKCYIYCTEKDYDKIFCVDKFMHKVFLDGNGKQKVIGEFVCDFITPFRPKALLGDSQIVKASCVKIGDLIEYAPNKPFPHDHIYGWHITNLVIYDKPKELGEFRSYNVSTYIDEEFVLPMPTHEIKRPFQSWGYVYEVDT